MGMGDKVMQTSTTTSDVSDREVLRTMELLGGSFASHLAIACVYADAENLARIKTAFAGMWDHYADVAAKRGEA